MFLTRLYQKTRAREASSFDLRSTLVFLKREVSWTTVGCCVRCAIYTLKETNKLISMRVRSDQPVHLSCSQIDLTVKVATFGRHLGPAHTATVTVRAAAEQAGGQSQSPNVIRTRKCWITTCKASLCTFYNWKTLSTAVTVITNWILFFSCHCKMIWQQQQKNPTIHTL